MGLAVWSLMKDRVGLCHVMILKNLPVYLQVIQVAIQEGKRGVRVGVVKVKEILVYLGVILVLKLLVIGELEKEVVPAVHNVRAMGQPSVEVCLAVSHHRDQAMGHFLEAVFLEVVVILGVNPVVVDFLEGDRVAMASEDHREVVGLVVDSLEVFRGGRLEVGRRMEGSLEEVLEGRRLETCRHGWVG